MWELCFTLLELEKASAADVHFIANVFISLLSVMRPVDWTVFGTPIQFCVSHLHQPINYYNPFFYLFSFVFTYPKFTWPGLFERWITLSTG